MKKLVALALALTLSVGAVGMLAACGDDSGDAALDGVVYDKRKGEIYKDTKENKTGIKISYTPGFGDEWAQQMARAFLLDEAGANYYMILDSDSELTTSVSSKLESGVGLSDIYFPLASSWQSYAAVGQLEPLDDLYATKVPGEERTVGEKIRGTWKTYGKMTVNDEEHYYVFPGNENVTGIVYNKDMFDKYNWKVPTTVAELTALCEQILTDTKGTVKPFVYPGAVAGGYWDFVGTNWWLQASGVEKLDEFMRFESAAVFDPLTSTSPSAGKRTMLKTFENLIVKPKDDQGNPKYILDGAQSMDHLRSPIALIQGKAAMIPNGNWIEKESFQDTDVQFRMMNVPFLDDAQKDADGNYISVNYPGQPDYMLIPKQANNKVGAKAFLAFISKDEVLKKYTETTGTCRPFDYDVSQCEVSDFAKSCLDVWQKSQVWFESSTSKLWMGTKVRKFNLSIPYSTLIIDNGKSTASSWCNDEYALVQKSWDQWNTEVG